MSFTEKSLKVSLDSQLKLIVGIVHQSSYCSASFSDLQVNIRSHKAGKGYIYLDGILKSNDNRALVLLIITIAENGSLATGDPMIFSTSPKFNKTPTTIQKEYQTHKNKIIGLFLLGFLSLLFYAICYYLTKSQFLLEVFGFLFSFSLWQAFEKLIYTLYVLKKDREAIAQRLLINVEID